MNKFLELAFLFFLGSVFGWVLELFFRRFISAANPDHKWINPGFCTGPYLPLYGLELCILYLLADMGERIAQGGTGKIAVIILMAVSITLVEYVAGIISLKITHVRLWDYSNEWGNIHGIICPKFSFFWTVLAAVYYLFVHQYIEHILMWLSNNIAFSFFIGVFFGIFIIDAAHSAHFVMKLKKYASDNDIIVKYEYLKASIRAFQDRERQKHHFFFPFRSYTPMSIHIKNMKEAFEHRLKK